MCLPAFTAASKCSGCRNTVFGGGDDHCVHVAGQQLVIILVHFRILDRNSFPGLLDAVVEVPRIALMGKRLATFIRSRREICFTVTPLLSPAPRACQSGGMMYPWAS